ETLLHSGGVRPAREGPLGTPGRDRGPVPLRANPCLVAPLGPRAGEITVLEHPEIGGGRGVFSVIPLGLGCGRIGKAEKAPRRLWPPPAAGRPPLASRGAFHDSTLPSSQPPWNRGTGALPPGASRAGSRNFTPSRGGACHRDGEWGPLSGPVNHRCRAA